MDAIEVRRYASQYRDGYYVVVDTATGQVVPPEPGHYKRYRDGYLWYNAAVGAADDLNKAAAVKIAARLEHLRGELRAERVSWVDLAELQSLAPHIPAGDVELLEAAGVPEHVEADS